MIYEWDPAKARMNRAKHGLASEAATRFDFERAIIFDDSRTEYGEHRQIALG